MSAPYSCHFVGPAFADGAFVTYDYVRALRGGAQRRTGIVSEAYVTRQAPEGEVRSLLPMVDLFIYELAPGFYRMDMCAVYFVGDETRHLRVNAVCGLQMIESLAFPEDEDRDLVMSFGPEQMRIDVHLDARARGPLRRLAQSAQRRRSPRLASSTLTSK